MPLHLGPFRRRRFLTTSLAAGAGILAEIAFPAAAAPAAKANSWVLISDPHVAGDLSKIVRGSCMADNLEQVVSEVITREAGGAGIIVSGDCAHLFGRKDDYRNLVSLIQPLTDTGRATHLLMGNHDDRSAFAKACAPFCPQDHPVPGKNTAMFASDHVNWFFLDSLLENKWVAGAIGKAQLGWLATMLDLHRAKPAIVVAHHHLALSAKGRENSKSSSALRDSADLMKLMRENRQVKAYVCGHTHQWGISRTQDGLFLVNLPPVGYVFRRSRPSGWVHATSREDGMTLDLHVLNQAHPDHGTRHFLKWRAAA